MNWEDWLKTAAKRPSDHEDSKREKTEKQIKDALAAYEPLQGRPYSVYVKGSYANNTNVRLNYDVDIAVEYRGYFYYDLDFELKGQDKSVVGIIASPDPYTREEFKSDILNALEASFGESAVEAGNIAYRVREGKTTLPADVVPCWEYRRYDRLVNGSPAFHEGARIFPTGGGPKDNYPKIQKANGIKKNDDTGRRYKRMVRALKKLQTKLVVDGILDKELLPSYLVECVVYNVPSDKFNHSTYKADMREVLAYVFSETLSGGSCNDWHEVHELHYLFRGHSWTSQQVHTVASHAWDLIGYE